MNGQPAYTDTDESGAQDNLLSVDPNDPQWKEQLSSWEDDKEYPIPTGTMRQISPGEFAIVKAKFADAGTSDEETPTEDTAEPGEEPTDEAAPEEPPMSKNPAMANFLKRRYKGA